jgi:ABC-type polysaccharide transport system permease subunit
MDYAYGTAIGVLKSVVSLILLFGTNMLAKKIRGESII